MENPKFTSNTQIEESGQWKNNGWNVTPSSTYGGNVGLGWKAFDKNPNSLWVSSKRYEAPNSGHLTITYPSTVNVTKMILYFPKHYDGRPSHSQTYTIQASKDGSSFTNVSTKRKIVEEQGNITSHELLFDTPITGKLFRFTARGIETVGLAEWKIFTGSTTAPPTTVPTSTTAPPTTIPTFQTPLPTKAAPIQRNPEDFSKYYTNENGEDISFNEDEMSCAMGCYEDDSCKGFAYDSTNKVCKPMNRLQETVPETFSRYRKKTDRVQINRNIKVELKYNISNNKAVVGQDYKTTSGLGIEYNQNAKVMHIVNQLSESKKLTHQYIPFTIQPIGNKYQVIANNSVLGKLKIKDSHYVVEK